MRPFETSVFQFDHDWQIEKFLSTLTHKQRHAIRKIRIPYDDVVLVDTRWDLTNLTGLKLVIVHDASYRAGNQDLEDAAYKLQGEGQLPDLRVKFIRPLDESGLRGMRGLFISYRDDIEQEASFRRGGYPGDWSLAESNRVIDRV